MERIDFLKLESWYKERHEKKISGRYITFSKIKPLIENLPEAFPVKEVGRSFLNIPIYKITAGKGKTKILLWSQMHGNETSGTKALFDLFKFLNDPEEMRSVRDQILNNCTLIFIPLLNPDGAEVFTRVNAQKIDLNRDAVDLKTPESNVLRGVLADIDPEYCFNLHDQRSLFTTGNPGKNATISFLAPSEGEDRVVTEGRKETMKVISSMYSLLKMCIAGRIGRYTDEFYPTATGDNFQKDGYHTILIESGHYKDDYNRENSRKFTFTAILQGIYSIATELQDVDYKDYFKIPENTKKHFDLILKGINLNGKAIDAGFRFKEELMENGQIQLIPEIAETGDLSTYIADKTIYNKEHFFKDQAELIAYIKKYTRIL